MRVLGLLSWYDEDPAWLAAGVASLASQVDHIVAVDGAYFLYPEGNARSPLGQASAIAEVARANDMGCTILEPPMVWAGNEVEKRTALFRLAEAVSEPDDWYFVLDGDEIVTSWGGHDLHRELAETSYDVGAVTFWNYRQHFAPHERPFVTDRTEQHSGMRILFRAIRGLAVKDYHYNYVTPDGRHLWGNAMDAPVEDAADFSLIRIEHRNKSRDLWRANQAKTYYKRRDSLNVEGLMDRR